MGLCYPANVEMVFFYQESILLPARLDISYQNLPIIEIPPTSKIAWCEPGDFVNLESLPSCVNLIDQ